MRAIIGALFVLCMGACGPTNEGEGEGGSGSSEGSGSGDAGGSDSGSGDGGDSSTGGLVCDPSTPDVSDAVTLTIRNDSTEPRYLTEAIGCSYREVFGLRHADSTEGFWWPVGPCETCAAAISGGCACPADCPADSAIRIDPGGVYVVQWSGVVPTRVQIPFECAHPNCINFCTALVQAEAGPYVASIVAGRTADCGDAECDCVDTPAPAGWCRVGGAASGEDAITVEREFQYPSGHSIELVIGGD